MTGTMYILGRKGDTRVTWDSENAQEVEQARKTFEAYKAKGFRAFGVKRSGEQGVQLTKFAPDKEEILFLTPIAGGR